MTLAERIAEKLSAEINKNVHYAAKGSVAWNALVLPAINEVLEEAAKVAKETPIEYSYCVGRDMLTVEKAKLTLQNAVERIRDLKG